MRETLIVAYNTFREIMRDRILYGIMVFAILLFGVSLALGQLSFQEQARVSVSFGFTAVHLSMMVLSIFVGSTLVAREIEKKTIFTLLVRPLSREQFLAGKALGLYSVITVLILGLSAVLALVTLNLDMQMHISFFLGIAGILLEALILLSITILFSTFTRPMLVVCFAVGCFLIGHWIGDLQYFAQKSDSQGFEVFAHVVSTTFPNLELLNWRDMYIYKDSMTLGHFIKSFTYAFAWSVAYLSLAAIIFRKKDFN